MKKLTPVCVGNYTFEAWASHFEGSVINVTVSFGAVSITRKLNHQGPHDCSEAEYEKAVKDFAQILAKELSGSLRSQELARNFTSS